MQASSVSSWLYFRNLHSGPSPYCPKVSFFFLILIDLHLYLTFTYPVIFLWLFNVLSLFFFSFSLGFCPYLYFSSCLWKISSTNPRCVYISVWVWIMCALLKQSLHFPHHAFSYIKEHVGIPELHSFWLKLNLEPYTLQCQMAIQSMVPNKNWFYIKTEHCNVFSVDVRFSASSRDVNHQYWESIRMWMG